MDAANPSSLTTAPLAKPGRSWLLANLPLRIKLLLAFLVMTTLATSAVAFFSDNSIRSSLTADAGERLQGQTQELALGVGNLVQRQVDLLRAFSLNNIVQDGIKQANTDYNLTPNIQNRLTQLDSRWAAAPETDPFVQDLLTNVVAGELQEYRNYFPDNVEIQVTDRYGALVGATNKVADYYQADEEWWQATWSNGQGAVWVGQPVFDQNTKSFSIAISVPVYGSNTASVAGILQATYRMDDLLDLLGGTRIGDTGGAYLIDALGTYTSPNKATQPLEADLLAQTQNTAIEYTEISYEGAPSFVSRVPVATITDNPVVAKLGWSVLVHQDRDEILAPVNATAQTTFLISLGTLVLAGLLALGIAQILSRPILRLTQAAQRLATGDLSHRLAFARSDEIGMLASSFDTMAATLEDRMAAEQAARADAQRLQQAETESRQHLELAVGEYLAFTQQVAHGDLTRRLPLRYEGALGELGLGLNAMVSNLHGITAQVQEATNAIASATAQILAATTEQAASSAEQSAAITETATSVEEVKVIAQQTARQATQIAEVGQSALQIAKQGGQAIESTIGGMGQVRAQVRQIAQLMHALTGHSQAIGTVITTVSELADQINHLGRNVAIESTRSGKQDQELSELARLVRELAERSKGASSEVRELLVEIQQATRSAVQGTEQGSKGVEEGAALVSQAGAAIHRLATEVEHGAQANVQMAAAAQQQMIGMEQIGLAMTAIQQATTQALLGTQQAEQAAQDLHSLAQSLQGAIATYRL